MQMEDWNVLLLPPLLLLIYQLKLQIEKEEFKMQILVSIPNFLLLLFLVLLLVKSYLVLHLLRLAVLQIIALVIWDQLGKDTLLPDLYIELLRHFR